MMWLAIYTFCFTILTVFSIERSGLLALVDAALAIFFLWSALHELSRLRKAGEL
jgi:hypothetical protein